MARIASDTDNTAVSCPLVHLTPPHTHIYIQYIFICTCQFYIPDSLAAGTLYTVDRKTPPKNAAGTFTLRLHFTSISCLAKNNKRKYNFTHISLGFFDEKTSQTTQKHTHNLLKFTYHNSTFVGWQSFFLHKIFTAQTLLLCEKTNDE